MHTNIASKHRRRNPSGLILTRSEEAERILSRICDRFEITLEELKGQGRTKRIAGARKEAYVDLRAVNFSWEDIASILNRKSHSTALRGVGRYLKGRDYLIKANSFEISVLTGVIMQLDDGTRQALSEIWKQLTEFRMVETTTQDMITALAPVGLKLGDIDPASHLPKLASAGTGK